MRKQGKLHTVFEYTHLNVTVFKSLKNEFPEVRFLLGSGQNHPKMFGFFFRNVTFPIRLKPEKRTISGNFPVNYTLYFSILMKAVTGKENN